MNNRLMWKTFVLAAMFVAGFAVIAFWNHNATSATRNAELLVRQENSENVLGSRELGDFYRTANPVGNQRIIELADSPVQIAVWDEIETAGSRTHYAISLDGKTVARIAVADNDLMLRYGKFDPLAGLPAIPSAFESRGADSGKAAYIVQFVTQPLEEYRQQIRAFGGKDYIYLPSQAQIFIMDDATRAQVASLPFVRWVGRYEPAYKLEEFLLAGLQNGNLAKTRYNIMMLDRGADMQGELAGKISGFGGKVENIVPQGFRMEATLTAEQLLTVANDSQVMFIDRWSAPESDMDIVRNVSGANFIESTLGYTGQGVRAEVFDGGFYIHNDFLTGLAPIMHTQNTSLDHGTATYGINFGSGAGNAAARGLVPSAQGIMADYDFLTNRYTLTAELKQAPYYAVYQSNSWGDAVTTAYTTISAEMDDILFKNDITILNSQSNTGNQTSRPQAWAKNIVSIGGIRHYNTPAFTDDRWANGASIGPAADGRIKPDLAHFYDSITTTYTSTTTGYGTFSGTSGATPITAGLFGLYFQMWHNGVFGNPTGATVFDSAPHMTTSKAIMINTAEQWDMTIAGTDTTRVRQGFGRADLNNLYNRRNKMMIVNESDVLTNLQTKSYTVKVPAGSTDPLKVTMIYADPMGSPSATRTRINNLDLKVTAPDGTIYYGNNGLLTGMWSTSGGTPNQVDTVENVFIQTPAAGNWKIEVNAAELIADARAETPGVIDADYALVASGIAPQTNGSKRFDYDGDGKADLSVFRNPGTWYIQGSTAGFSAVGFGTTGDTIVPADYDGDGKTDIAVFRSGTWYIQRSSAGFVGIGFGLSSDVPTPGDYDGDGKADLAVFRSGTWYVQGSTAGFYGLTFGVSGDKPVPADYDGDGKTDIAVNRNNVWYIQRSTAGFTASTFGSAGDVLVPADYDGDGKTDIAVFRSGTWYVQGSTAGFYGVPFGVSDDIPVAADYDGDGKADLAVFRSGTWYEQRSASGFAAFGFGVSGDIPTPAAYNR